MYNETLRLAQGVDALTAPLAELNTADAVEYLNTLDRDAAAHLLAVLPQPRAVKLLEQPELRDASALVAQLPAEHAAVLLGQMADDRATDIFHGLDADQREPLLWRLSAEARLSIQALMRYPPNTAGALMTTEFVAVPSDWTVGRTLQHIRDVERSRETVYAIYLLDPHTRVLQQVVTMRRLITGAAEAPILEVAQVNPRLPWTRPWIRKKWRG